MKNYICFIIFLSFIITCTSGNKGQQGVISQSGTPVVDSISIRTNLQGKLGSDLYPERFSRLSLFSDREEYFLSDKENRLKGEGDYIEMEESFSPSPYSRIPAKYWLRNGHSFSVPGYTPYNITIIKSTEPDKKIDAEAMFFAELLDSVYLRLEYLKREQYLGPLFINTPQKSSPKYDEYLNVKRKEENYNQLIQNETLHKVLKKTYDTQLSFLERRKPLVSENFYMLCNHFFLCDYILELSLCYVRYRDGRGKEHLKEILMQYKNKIQHDDLLFSYRYRMILSIYNNLILTENKNVGIAERWRIARENFSGKTLDYLLFRYAKDAIAQKDFTLVEQYLAQDIDDKFHDYIKIRLEVAKQNDNLDKGILSSDTLFTPDGGKIDMQEALNKYKGKYLYLDFWASWCSPCRALMPKSLQFKQQFKNSIDFIYLSTDEDFTSWLQAIKAEGLKSTDCYLISNRSRFVKLKQIKSIPRYMLIDYEGRIIDDDCFRPDDPDFVVKMNRILNR